MHFHCSNLTGDGDEDQEFLDSAEEETINQLLLLSEDDKRLPLMKRKRSKIHKDPKRMKLFREKLLKRPIFQLNDDPFFEFEPPPELPPPPAAVFDSETESDTDTEIDGYQEAIANTIPPELAANIPQEYKTLMNFMGGSSSASPSLVVEKRLKKGDVEERRNRFLIPQRKISTNFLEVEEEEKLNMERWWTVEIIEPDCSVSLITLSKWETRKGPAYVLITEWNGLVERNELKEGDLMQLWSFRADGGGDSGGPGRLCFMLLEIGDGHEGEVPRSLESSG